MPYAVNEGTNSAGETAAGASARAEEPPVGPPEASGPPEKGGAQIRGRRACAEDPEGHEAGAADRDAPSPGR